MPVTTPSRSAKLARRVGVVVLGWVAGGVPYSNIAARAVAGVDLRAVGTGTVSGTGLFEVGGLAPLIVAGGADVAKGALGPLLAGDDFWAAAGAGVAAVAGHNWSPWLGWQGGRGLSVALGATAVIAPASTAVLATTMLAGRIARHSGLGAALGIAALPAAAALTRGPKGAVAGLGLASVMFAKRLSGNGPAPSNTAGAYLRRLAFDNDGASRDR